MAPPDAGSCTSTSKPEAERGAPASGPSKPRSAVARWLAEREAAPNAAARWRVFVRRIGWPFLRSVATRVGRALLQSVNRRPGRWACGTGGGLSGFLMMWMMWSPPWAPRPQPHEPHHELGSIESVRTSEVAPSTAGAPLRPPATPPGANGAPATATAASTWQPPLASPALPSTAGRVGAEPSPFYTFEAVAPSGASGPVRQAGFATAESAPAVWLVGTIETGDETTAWPEAPLASPATTGSAPDDARPTTTPPPYVPAQYGPSDLVRLRAATSTVVPAGDPAPVIRPVRSGSGPMLIAPR